MDFATKSNNREIKLLKNSLNTGKISHSYLFEGEKGVGKKEVALAFSKGLVCKSDDERPCNKCSSCLKFESMNHPDFKMISSTKKIIQKKEIEALIREIPILPFESKKKVFLIEDGDLMRSDSQNALLKTLEEPPPYVVMIILTSNSNKILDTISSRCEIIKFHRRNDIDKIFKMENFADLREEIIDVIDNLISGNQIYAFTSLDIFSKNKENTEQLLDIMMYWFRDLAIYKEVGASDLLLNKDKLDLLLKQSFLDMNKIHDIIYRIEATKLNINRNINFNLSIETMLLNI